MAVLVFPLTFIEFWDRLPMIECPINLEVYESVSGTRGGETLTSELAEAKWVMDPLMAAMHNDTADDIKGTINALMMRGSGGTFFARDIKRKGLRRDPTGAGLNGFTPTVLALDGRHSLRVAGLPPDYHISRGDWISIRHDHQPERFAFMQVAEGAPSNGSGQTPFLPVTPFVKAGVTIGMAVNFVQAPAKMMVRPGSFDPGKTGLRATTGMRFTAVEAF